MNSQVIDVVSAFFGKYTSRRYRIVRCRDAEGDFFVAEAIWPGGWSDIGVEAHSIANARTLAEQFDLESMLARDERKAGV